MPRKHQLNIKKITIKTSMKDTKASEEDIELVLYDNYELTMMRGEAFNFWNSAIYFNGEI